MENQFINREIKINRKFSSDTNQKTGNGIFSQNRILIRDSTTRMFYAHPTSKIRANVEFENVKFGKILAGLRAALFR